MSDPQANTYWCHQCSKEIRPRDGLTCPDCHTDFIEIVEPDDRPQNFTMFRDDSQGAAAAVPPAPAPQPPPPQAPGVGVRQPMAFQFQFGNPAGGNANGMNAIMQMVQQMLQPPAGVAAPAGATVVFPMMGQIPVGQQQPGAQPNMAHPFAQAQPNVANPFAQMMNALFAGNFGQFDAMMGTAFGIPGNPGDYAHGGDFQNLLNTIFQQAVSRGNPPAAQSAIDALPLVAVSQAQVNEQLDCSICKEEFALDEHAATLPCNHYFHPDCITRWLKMHNQCPVCRYELPTDDPDYEQRRRERANSSNSVAPNSAGSS